MTLSRRRFAGTVGAAALGAMPVIRALAQDALDAIPDGPLKMQIAWLLEVMNDPDISVTEDEVVAHFDESFLSAVSSSQVIEIFDTLRGQLRGITVSSVEIGPSGSDAVLTVIGSTGLALDVSIVVAPASGLISGLLFEPGEASDASEASPAAVASPAASPVAAVTPPPTTDEILADYQAAAAALQDAGRTLTDAFIAGDDETVSSLLSPQVAGMLAGFSAQDAMAELTTNIVSFSLGEVRAFFAGHFTPEGISGLFHQGTPAYFQLTPDAPQAEGYPTGFWIGEILIGAVSLGIEVTFSGTAETLSATISIPEQSLRDHPLTDVRFEAERPLGELVEERALPMGPLTGTSSFGASYAWGDMTVAINSAFNEANEGIAISAVMQPTLPPDPAAGASVTAEFRLPFDGAWMVIWGGETEFRNYHAPVPPQRHAYDIVIWRDGATYTGDGSSNEMYHCYGQPQYAPAAGTVVVAVDGYEDDTPGQGPTADPMMHPAGNHIVIEVGEGEYLLMAHFQPGTIAVAEGDVVVAGDLVGLTGNSGNSSEPHVHIHLQSTPDMFDPSTIGLPLAFTGYTANGEPVDSAPLLQGQIVERSDA
jgi:hypothetical protein